MTEGSDPPRGVACAERVDLRLKPAKQELRRLAPALEAFSTAQCLAPKLANALALALEEAVTNVFFYAFENDSSDSQEIGVVIERRGDAVHVTVRDNGRPFDPTAREMKALPTSLGDLAPGGLGIRIIRSVANRVEYRREQGCNHLELELAIDAGDRSSNRRIP